MAVDLLYSETERDLAAALADLLASQAAPADVIARTERPETYDAKLWRTVAAEIGIAGLLIPEALGGAGASYRELAAAAEQFGAAVAPIPYLGSAAVATAVLLSAARATHGTGARRRTSAGRRPRPARAGRWTSAAAVRARGGRAGRRAARPGRVRRVRTVRTARGPGLAGRGAAAPAGRRHAHGGARGVRGHRARGAVPRRRAGHRPGGRRPGRRSGCAAAIHAVPDALPADVLLVPGGRGAGALYLVEANAAGVHRTPLVSLDMTRQLCDITLDDALAGPVAVGAAAEAAVSAGLAAGAAVLAAEQLGLAQRCLDMTVAYVKERRQFARQIGSFQAVKHRLADLWTTITLARAASRYAAACLADDDPDAPVAVALAKSACCDAAVTAAQECVQLHGGIGFTWEHPAHLYLKRAKAASVAYGTPGAHRAALADLVNLPAPPP